LSERGLARAHVAGEHDEVTWSHDSGERTNAPLVCFLVGLAVGRSTATLDTAVEIALGGKAPR